MGEKYVVADVRARVTMRVLHIRRELRVRVAAVSELVTLVKLGVWVGVLTARLFWPRTGGIVNVLNQALDSGHSLCNSTRAFKSASRLYQKMSVLINAKSTRACDFLSISIPAQRTCNSSNN